MTRDYIIPALVAVAVFLVAVFIGTFARAERQQVDVALVLAISGDGKHNSGPDFASIRQSLLDAGVVINGLPIMGAEDDIDVFYADNVIGGPGAFMVAAGSFDHFAGAIQMKLMTEIGMME